MRFLTALAAALAATALMACTKSVSKELAPSVETSSSAAGAAAPALDGPPAPDFTLADTAGKTHSLAAYTAAGKTVVLEWFNPECPVVKSYHDPGKMLAVQQQLADDDVIWLAINSGAPGKQGHGTDKNEAARAAWLLPYPVLIDESGDVGRAYQAKTTPHMYVIQGGVIVYQGAIDGSKAGAAGTNFVINCFADLEAGRKVKDSDTAPFGCSVKYAN